VKLGVRLSLLVAATAGGLIASGCGGSPPTTPPPDTRVFCQIHHGTCLEADASFTTCLVPWEENGNSLFNFLYDFKGGDPMDPTAGVPQTPFSYADAASYKPSGVTDQQRLDFAPGQWTCAAAGDARPAEEVCASLCGSNRAGADTAAGRANPAFHPPILGGDGTPYCVGFEVKPPAGTVDMCLQAPPPPPPPSQRGALALLSAPLPGSPTSSDLFVDVVGQGTGTNTVTIEGATGDIPVVGGHVSLKLPDPYCRNETPCRGRLNSLELRYGGIIYTFDDTDYSITDLTISLNRPLDVTIEPGGPDSFRIKLPPGVGLQAVARRDGLPQGMLVNTPDESLITYNPATGVVSTDLTWSAKVGDATLGGTTFTTSTTVFNRPPNVQAGADITQGATDATCVASVSVNGTASDPDGDLIGRAWTASGSLLSRTNGATTELPLGDHVLRFNGLDAHGAHAIDELTVHVTDATLPVFVDAPPSVSLHGCAPGESAFQLALPEVDNPCSDAAPTLSGSVVSSNGVPVSIPIAGDTVTLAAGLHTVRWVATNANGSVSFDQELRVLSEPTLYASHRLNVQSKALITAEGGLFGTLMNVGNAPGRHGHGKSSTLIGERVETGDVLSTPFLSLGRRSHVHGAVLYSGGLDRARDALVDLGLTSVDAFPGAQVPWAPPAFGGSQAIRVRRGQTLTLAPGNYRSLDVERGGTLVLSNGQYGFRDIDVDSGSNVRVPDTSGGVSLFAQDDLSFRATVVTAANVAAPLLLGNAGDDRVELEAPFWGVAVAPYATLVLGEGCHGASPWRHHHGSDDDALPEYRGRFYAKELEVRPKVSVLHDSLLCQSDP
jgi:hypothetical protein